MKDLKEIRAEIRKLVTDTVENGVIGHVEFFTRQVMMKYSSIEGDDADFYLICAREIVVREVKNAIGKFDKPEDDTPLMDGFENLHTAYPVHRGKEHLLVPVQLLTDAELEERAEQYEAAAAGYLKHADDIRRYIKTRRDQPSGPWHARA